jgi:hypothetical protein
VTPRVGTQGAAYPFDERFDALRLREFRKPRILLVHPIGERARRSVPLDRGLLILVNGESDEIDITSPGQYVSQPLFPMGDQTIGVPAATRKMVTKWR